MKAISVCIRALNAAQMAEVDRWFAVGLNQQINQLLAAPAMAKGTK